jgi:NADPH:quinone reductase-like Zn-dependent oxidoreductase
MRAYHLTGNAGRKDLKPVDLPKPAPGSGEVLVRMRAASLNYRDLLVADGHYGSGVPDTLVPLSDGAGEVLALGDGVGGLAVGDRVAGAFYPDWISGPITAAARRRALGGSLDGVLAEYVVLPAHAAIPVPEHLSFEEAATLPCAALTAWNALTEVARLRPGETVALQGSGGVSVMALQFAKLMGARVIHTSGSAEKRERLAALGADHVLDHTAEPGWDRAVLDLTDGVGADLVIEVGGPGTLEQSFRAVRVGGAIVSIGFVAGGSTIDPRAIISRCIRLTGITVGSCDMFRAMNRAIGQTGMRPVIDRVYAFEEAAEAYERLRSGGHFGKLVVAI